MSDNLQPRARYLTRSNSTYDERAQTQLRLWQQGVPVHNDIDNECCPDFSCCRGSHLLASQKLRDMFVRDPASRPPMMELFISELSDEMKALYDLPNSVGLKRKPN